MSKSGSGGGVELQPSADRYYLATLGPIPRLWCLACDKSEHAAEAGAEVDPDHLAELRRTHRCGERTSPWDAGEIR